MCHKTHENVERRKRKDAALFLGPTMYATRYHVSDAKALGESHKIRREALRLLPMERMPSCLIDG
jgi:hypothetical protein